MRMLLTDTQMDRLEARFGANYQARKLNADDIAIAFALGLSLAAMFLINL